MTVSFILFAHRILHVSSSHCGACGVFVKLIIVSASIYEIGLGVLFTSQVEHSTSDYFMTFAYFYDPVHSVVLYFWCCRFLGRMQRLSPDIVRWSNLHIGVLFGFVLIMCSATLWENIVTIMPGAFDSLWLRWLVGVTDVVCYSFIARGLIAVLHVLIGAQFRAAARQVDRRVTALTSGSCSVSWATQTTIRICSDLTGQFSTALYLIHAQYFIRFLTDLPVAVALRRVSWVTVANVASCLHAYLIVVAGGNALYQSGRRLRKFLRERLWDRRKAVQIYLRTEHGVMFGGGPLSWNSACSYIGFLWSFTFLVFEVFASNYRASNPEG